MSMNSVNIDTIIEDLAVCLRVAKAQTKGKWPLPAKCILEVLEENIIFMLQRHDTSFDVKAFAQKATPILPPTLTATPVGERKE